MPDPCLYITLPRTTAACTFIVCARKRPDGRCATPVVCLPPPAPSAAPSLPPPPTHLSVICPLPDRTRRPPPTPFSTPPCVTFLWRCSALHQLLTRGQHALHCLLPLFCPPPGPPCALAPSPLPPPVAIQQALPVLQAYQDSSGSNTGSDSSPGVGRRQADTTGEKAERGKYREVSSGGRSGKSKWGGPAGSGGGGGQGANAGQVHQAPPLRLA